jgi:hypothetical protein
VIKEIDIHKLKELIDKEHPNSYMVHANLFALGCLLHLQGQVTAGKKAISTVLRALPEQGNKGYFSSILDNLSGNERQFASGINAHLEINELFQIGNNE